MLNSVEQKAVDTYESTAEICCALLARKDLHFLWTYPDFSGMKVLVTELLGVWRDKLPEDYFHDPASVVRKHRQFHADACITCSSVFDSTYGGRLREICPVCMTGGLVPKGYINIYWHLWMLSQELNIPTQLLSILTANSIRRRFQLGYA